MINGVALLTPERNLLPIIPQVCFLDKNILEDLTLLSLLNILGIRNSPPRPPAIPHAQDRHRVMRTAGALLE